jgi:hypothetical protein
MGKARMTIIRRSPIAFTALAGFLATSCSNASMPSMPDAPQTARYRVTFDSRWSSATHPVDIPANAHFSSLIGGTHASSVTFWADNTLASTGIKDMAERGRITPLDQEVQRAISAGTAEHLLTGPNIPQSPSSTSFEFSVSQRFPLVTLVTMVAPSPDWFVGVAGLPLFERGQWRQDHRVDLDPWDAGTDSGQSFLSPDLVTSPPAPISRILTAPLSPNGRVTPLGSFVFTKIQ